MGLGYFGRHDIGVQGQLQERPRIDMRRRKFNPKPIYLGTAILVAINFSMACVANALRGWPLPESVLTLVVITLLMSISMAVLIWAMRKHQRNQH